MIPRFVFLLPQLIMIFNEIIYMIDTRQKFNLSDLNQQWMAHYHLVSFANVIYNKAAALDNVSRFTDDTLRGTTRPKRNQRVIYNRHKQKHGLKYQSFIHLME